MFKNPRRRRHRRYGTLLLLDVETEGSSSKKARSAVIDISLSGAAFESSEKFSIGEKVTLRFITPQKNIYVISGKIRRTASKAGAYEYGVKFRWGNPLKRNRVKQLISEIS